MATKKIILHLTEEEISKMSSQLMQYDEGPGDEGWWSEATETIIDKFDEARKVAK